MFRINKKAKPENTLHYCIYCRKTFFSTNLSMTLTVKCPHCKKAHLFEALIGEALFLIRLGMSKLSHAMCILDEVETFETDEHIMLEAIRFGKAIMFQTLNEMEPNTDLSDFDEMHDHELTERVEGNYFEKNVGSKLIRGKIGRDFNSGDL